MSERDDAAVTLRLTAAERRVVREALLHRANRLRRLERSCLRLSDRREAAEHGRIVRRVLALVTEDGDE
ncbi:MAG: hypothetical protein IT337_16890 [Thermomicrobiales bacterium]|nr:hypothetical protein [Thermomicrobiales bacterium]